MIAGILILAVIIVGGLFAFYKVPALNSAFHDAESLFLPALQAVVSFATGVLALIDWSPLAGLVNSAGATMHQLLAVAVVSFLQAIGLYVARKARDPAMKG